MNYPKLLVHVSENTALSFFALQGNQQELDFDYTCWVRLLLASTVNAGLYIGASRIGQRLL
jgi:hypothetical protein